MTISKCPIGGYLRLTHETFIKGLWPMVLLFVMLTACFKAFVKKLTDLMKKMVKNVERMEESGFK